MTQQYSHHVLSTDEVEILYSPKAQQTVSIIIPLAHIAAQSSACGHSDAEITVKDAILASKITEQFADIDILTAHIGIWGRKVSLDCLVHGRDRIEIYRPLITDPKETRRLRYKKQGPVQSRHRPGYKGP